MKIERDQIFHELEPPPGGAARLRAKLRAGRAAPLSGGWWLGPVAVAVIAAVTIVAFRLVPQRGPAPEADNLMAAAAFDRLLRRESDPYDLSISSGDQRLAVRELESSNPSVRLYRIEPNQPDPAGSGEVVPGGAGEVTPDGPGEAVPNSPGEAVP